MSTLACFAVCRAPVQRWLPAASLPSEASLSFSSVGKVGTNCGPANYCMPQFQLHAVCMLAFNETAGIITQLHHSIETLCAQTPMDMETEREKEKAG